MISVRWWAKSFAHQIQWQHLSVFFSFILAFSVLGCTRQEEGREVINPLKTAEETVRAFCDKDAAGKRLSSATWREVRPYIAWTEEPGWDEVTVIKEYRIAKTVSKSSSRALVTVEYSVLGRSSDEFISMKTSEMVQFTVKKTKTGWKIVQPDFMPPHVLPKPLIAHLEKLQNAERVAAIRRELAE